MINKTNKTIKEINTDLNIPIAISYGENEVTAETIVKETQTELFTPQELADLNLSKCLRSLK